MKNALAPIVFPDTRILILGSMPGEKSLELQQYYGNRGNHFWKLMFQVFDEEFTTDYSHRIALLRCHQIGLWDVLAACERIGSLDSNIRNEVANDFNSFFENHLTIRTVFFSSKAAAAYYNKYAVKHPGVDYLTLPSPSGANAGKSFAQKLEEWQILRRI